jgi:hypothetical protein
MDLAFMTPRWSRAELQAAHDNFIAVANDCADRREWRAWADLFTEDAHYLEHTFGEFHGREEIYAWITSTMAQWPNSDMTAFPHEWCVCDEERGWWVCRILNRMADPGDGGCYEEPNLTVLHYAGNMLFSYEEDVYNPAKFGPMIQAWMAAGGSPVA